MDLQELKKFLEKLQPRLASESDDDLNIYIELTSPLLADYEKCLGDNYTKGMAYALSHIFAYTTTNAGTPVAGEVSSISQRDTNISFATGVAIATDPSDDAFWQTTPAGNLLLKLLDACGCFGFYQNPMGTRLC